MKAHEITVKRIEKELDIARFDDNAWDAAAPVIIDKYWSGEPAPPGRTAEVRLLWSDKDLYVRFDAAQTEPLVVSDSPELSQKAMGLWERDVCEIFIAPDAARPNKYFEFEIAPTGEWLDLAIELDGDQRITDAEYNSKVRHAARIDKDRVNMSLAIPFASLGSTPASGDWWLGNLFRCVGSGSSRGYLAWQPTFTDKPNFHVPTCFAPFLFG